MSTPAPRIADRSHGRGRPYVGVRVGASIPFWYHAVGEPVRADDNADCRRQSVDGLTTTFTYGNYYVVQLRERRTERRSLPIGRCVLFDGSELALQPPPPPPTEAEFVEAARAVLTVETSSESRGRTIGGLTGLGHLVVV